MKIAEIILDRQKIADRINVLGQQITADYRGKNFVLIGVLNGAFIFLADLARTIDLEAEVDFIRVASYDTATETSGSIRLSKEPELDLTGKDVLLVEDIVDSGITMTWLHDYFMTKHQPDSIKTCALIDKHERRAVEVKVDYVGFQLNRGFLVGYGLDYAQKYRTLPEVCALEV
jgi:hypoxanthine phosphoribosyltransferase